MRVLAVAVGDALGTAEAQRVIRVDRQKIFDVEARVAAGSRPAAAAPNRFRFCRSGSGSRGGRPSCVAAWASSCAAPSTTIPAGEPRKHLDGQSRFGQDGVVAAVGIEIEHPLTEAKPGGECHHDVGVGAGFADGRDDRWPQLDMPQSPRGCRRSPCASLPAPTRSRRAG